MLSNRSVPPEISIRPPPAPPLSSVSTQSAAKLCVPSLFEYDADPKQEPKARRYERLTFDEAIQKNLRVMDQTALALCRENGLPILVFDSGVPGNLQKVATGEQIGTLVGT